MASSTSCSHWWHAPFYVAATVAIIVAAFSSPPTDNTSPNPNSNYSSLSSHLASLALNRSGFHLASAIVQLTRITSCSTIFVIPDDVMSNLSNLQPLHAKEIHLYHVVPIFLTSSNMSQLLNGSRLPTLLHGQDLTLTRHSGSIRINGVDVTHTDFFLTGSLAIHGVNGPFLSMKRFQDNSAVQWDKVVRVLNSHGFASFALALNSVVGTVEKLNGSGVTVFAPHVTVFDYLSLPRPLLERAVRSQLALGRMTYKDLEGMLVGEAIRTMDHDGLLRITDGGDGGKVAVNGVYVIEPDVYLAEGLWYTVCPSHFGWRE